MIRCCSYVSARLLGAAPGDDWMAQARSWVGGCDGLGGPGGLWGRRQCVCASSWAQLTRQTASAQLDAAA